MEGLCKFSDLLEITWEAETDRAYSSFRAQQDLHEHG
jgi:hypothetical protein